ncbi:MAG: hypothetical protein JSV17_00030 [Candidatus Aminicenantes bacterium]|nr:MAG: hypothetical protein JSV17_00030 [Candidatus Aminicenantes bacterium]
MKHKTLGIGFVLLVLIGCATVHRDDPIDIYQKTQSYKNYSFGDVWSAAIKSVNEMEFVIKKATKNVGLIHAEVKRNPNPHYLPPLMNVVIKDVDGRIEVNFHIELPGQKDDAGKRRTYSNRFFKTLRKNLK